MSLKIVKTFSLDFTRNGPLEYIYVKAGDKDSRVLDIVPLNSGNPYEIPAGAKVVFMAKKSDKKEILNDATIDDGHIKVLLSEQTLAAEGIVVCEVAIYDAEGAFLSSQHFYMKAQSRVLNEVESSDEYKSLVVALLAVDTKVREAERVIDEAKKAAESAAKAEKEAKDAADAVNASLDDIIALQEAYIGGEGE